MHRIWLTLTLPLVLLVGGCRGDIPVVGFDAEGKAIETLLPKRKYVQHVAKNVNDLSQSVVPVADSEEYGRLLSGLRAIRLGIGVQGSVGLGEFFKLGGTIAFHLHFANRS